MLARQIVQVRGSRRVALIVVVLILASASGASAVEYLGDFCWDFTSATHGSGTMRLGVVHLGGGNYFLSGATGGEATHGSATLSGGQVVLTTVSSGGNASYTWSFIGRAVLDPSTLNGTLEIMGVGHNKASADPEQAYSDYDGPFTMTFTGACD